MTKTSETTSAVAAAVAKARAPRRPKADTLAVRNDNALALADRILSGLPPAPVRAWNAFGSQYKRPEGGPSTSEAWNQLPQAEKDKYKAAYAQQKDARNAAIAALSDEHRKILKLAAKLRRAKDKDSGSQVTRARTPFMFFNKAHHAEVRKRGLATFTDVSKAVGADWRALDSAGREPYVLLAKQDALRHANDLKVSLEKTSAVSVSA